MAGGEASIELVTASPSASELLAPKWTPGTRLGL
jgi:hypothetical protein